MSVEARTVKITGLSATTTKEGLSAFLSFCGQIEDIQIEGTSGSVTFAKESAAKTAELLSGGSLDGSTLSIETTASQSAHTGDDDHVEGSDIAQEHKPRSAVIAEILSQGYILSDQAIAKAIELDHSYGISARFLKFFKPLSEQVTTKATELDQTHHISEKAVNAANTTDAKLGVKENVNKATQIGKQYYSSALQSPVGAKVSQFYTQTAKQVLDVHEEAKRIAASRKPVTLETQVPTAPATAGVPVASTSAGAMQ